MLSGILFGLASAVCASLAYLASRAFLLRCRRDLLLLFAVSSVQMGGLCLLALPWVHAAPLPPAGAWFVPLLSTAGFYWIGQLLLFRALRGGDSSRISPLLGLKVPILALLSAGLFGGPLSAQSWGAIAICTLGSLLVAPPHRIDDRAALGWALAICLFYAGSDLSIPGLITALGPSGGSPALTGACLTYLLSALVVLPWLSRHPDRLRTEIHRAALPFSLAWTGAMATLFCCFDLVGPIYGTMLQSTRGMMSVLLGAWLARRGHLDLERLAGGWALALRFAGALLMALGIGLFRG